MEDTFINVKVLLPDSKVAKPFEVVEGATVSDLLEVALNGDFKDVESKYTVSVNREPASLTDVLDDDAIVTLGPKKVTGGIV